VSHPGSGNLGLRFSPPAFLLGFLAAPLQILLLREFAAHFYGSELVFGFVLAGWLLWGGLGGLWASRIKSGRPSAAALLFSVTVLAPLVFAGLRFSRFVLGTLPGELTGLLPAGVFAFGLTLLLNAPLGAAFVQVAKSEGPLARVYLWESAGAASGGLTATLVLVPQLSNWLGLAVLGAAVLVVLALVTRRAAAVAPILLLAALAVFDGPSQKLFWKPFDLVRSHDGLYGQLSVIRTAEQVSLYSDGFRVYSSPDPAAAEEAVHFAMLQNPSAHRILLVGGGAGGGIAELLKYPRTEIDYVELDPDIIRLSEEFLGDAAKSALRDPRVRIVLTDGRTFLESSRERYDAVILDLPEPATAQINRFYTLEFFRAARERLVDGGIFSFRVPSAENYIAPPLARFLATMDATLQAAFPEVAVVPGEANIFLASVRPLLFESDLLARRLAGAGIRTKYVTPAQIAGRLHPWRIEALRKALESGPRILNTDLHPVNYYFHAVLWSRQFGGWEARLLDALADVPARRLVDVPLLVAVLLFAGFLWKAPASGRTALPMALMGLTTMAVELLVLIRYQTLHGIVYGRLAALLAAFMAGLALGALRGALRKSFRPSRIIFLQAGLLGLVLLLESAIESRPSGFVLGGSLSVLGFLGGDFFVIAAALAPDSARRAGLAYGADLLGSFAAAAVLSAVLIPLAGLPALFRALVVLNSFGLLYLIVVRNRL
jgi:spermidine synthase